MAERAYTVKELDALRQVLGNKWLWGTYHFPSGLATSRSFKQEDMTKTVEEMVRTHMLAGHTADDLLASEREPAHPGSTEG